MASIPIHIKNKAGTTLFTIDGEKDVASGISNNYKPVWATQEIPKKEGNIKQFMGTGDGDVEIAGVLMGTQTEKVNQKNELRSIALAGTIVRIDTGGYDTSIENRDYVITNVNVPLQGGRVWQFNIVFEEHNN